MIDNIVPFYLDGALVRGRCVRLGDDTKKSLLKHNYPAIINKYIIELLSVASVLATDVKTQGQFTLQIMGNNAPIKLLVVEITDSGKYRFAVKYDAEQLSNTLNTATLKALFGAGHMLFSARVKDAKENYQAAVELMGDSLQESVSHYFNQSNQIPTLVKIFSTTNIDGDILGGALVLQKLPNPQIILQTEEIDDLWETHQVLLETLTADEFYDAALDSPTLLYRLFNQHQLITQPAIRLTFECSCSQEKLARVLITFPKEDLQSIVKNNQISADCEYCKTTYTFSLENLLKQKSG